MRTALKWLFRTIIWSAVLLLFVIAAVGAAFWLRGHSVADVYRYNSDKWGQLQFVSDGGLLYFDRICDFDQLRVINSNYPEGPIHHETAHPSGIYYQPHPGHEDTLYYTRRLGVVICDTRYILVNFRDRNGKWASSTHHYLIQFPAWMLVPLAVPYLTMMGLMAFRWQRQRRRWKGGRCMGCGYDLHGNDSGRCPECGRPFKRVAGRSELSGSPTNGTRAEI